MQAFENPMVSRREWMKLSLGAGVALTLSPVLLGALQQPSAKLVQRAIPSSGEMVPIIALGRGWSKSLDRDGVKGALKTLIDNGGKVFCVHGGPDLPPVAGAIANELGVQDKIFWVATVTFAAPPNSPPLPAPRAQLETLLSLFKVSKIDLIQVAAHPDVAKHLRVLYDFKKEGLIRYLGVTDLAPPPMAKMPAFTMLESMMRTEPIDFVSMDYSVGDRRAEEKILPLAQQRKIGVMSLFPLDRGRIFQRASATPLPDWAAEFDANTWAQFFLKYVVANPAVTLVRTGTSNPAHMLDDIGAAFGRLPDEAMRKRMAKLVDSLPPTPQPTPQPKPPGGKP